MNDPITVDDLLERLEDSWESGQPIDVEELCREYPKLAAPLRSQWKLLRSFDRKFGTDG